MALMEATPDDPWEALSKTAVPRGGKQATFREALK
ncbi:hypothetical protein KL86PLE_30575 [uncultured Pleomorphomonas sp.]|uniref:Uncharacterized protein n=1 Tax=uncultured Pleomorphomonas sp. TaxID=442121 RepID=A0A212LF83_9HYPH|nr:hypothetical protein KL86PLE_30575 [uncultured Pleomorphomonas sp.]